MGLGKIGGTPASPLAGGLPPLVDSDRWLAVRRGLPVRPVDRHVDQLTGLGGPLGGGVDDVARGSRALSVRGRG
jgi:hypothetical protein